VAKVIRRVQTREPQSPPNGGRRLHGEYISPQWAAVIERRIAVLQERAAQGLPLTFTGPDDDDDDTPAAAAAVVRAGPAPRADGAAVHDRAAGGGVPALRPPAAGERRRGVRVVPAGAGARLPGGAAKGAGGVVRRRAA
jgi:hypothetical protein